MDDISESERTVEIDVPFTVAALTRLTLRARGQVMTRVLEACAAEKPSPDQAAMRALFLRGGCIDA